VWFTKARDADTLYAFLPNNGKWSRGKRREFTLKSVRATDATALSVLGHAGRVLEYNPKADVTPRFEQTTEGLKISVVRAQRLYNNSGWPRRIRHGWRRRASTALSACRDDDLPYNSHATPS